MSGIVKGIGKVFKSIGKAFKKVLAPVLAIGALVFTGGAALGLPAFAGGFGGAVAKGLSAIGLKGGVLGKIITGAVTHAGYGAAVGGVTSALTGGSFKDGAAKGALGGLITGGIVGGFGGTVDPLSAVFKGKGVVTGATTSSAVVDAVTPTAAGTGLAPSTATLAGTAPSSTTAASGLGAGAAAGTAQAGTGFLGGFFKSQAGGQVLAGLGQGLLQGMQQKDIEKQRAAEEQRERDSYEGAGEALRFAKLEPGQKREPTGYERFLKHRKEQEDAIRGNRRHYSYDPDEKRIKQA